MNGGRRREREGRGGEVKGNGQGGCVLAGSRSYGINAAHAKASAGA